MNHTLMPDGVLPIGGGDVPTRLLGLVRETYLELNRQSVGPVAVGFDSLARVELLTRIERAFGRRLPEALLAQAQTPRDLRPPCSRHPIRLRHRPVPIRQRRTPPTVRSTPRPCSRCRTGMSIATPSSSTSTHRCAPPMCRSNPSPPPWPCATRRVRRCRSGWAREERVLPPAHPREGSRRPCFIQRIPIPHKLKRRTSP